MLSVSVCGRKFSSVKCFCYYVMRLSGPGGSPTCRPSWRRACILLTGRIVKNQMLKYSAFYSIQPDVRIEAHRPVKVWSPCSLYQVQSKWVQTTRTQSLHHSDVQTTCSQSLHYSGVQTTCTQSPQLTGVQATYTQSPQLSGVQATSKQSPHHSGVQTTCTQSPQHFEVQRICDQSPQHFRVQTTVHVNRIRGILEYRPHVQRPRHYTVE